MSKKKQIRIFPILCIIIVIAVTAWAASLVKNIFTDDKNEDNNNATDTDVTDKVIDSESENTDDMFDGSEDAPEVKEPEVPSIPQEPLEEDSIEFNQDAPLPVYTQAELLEMFPDTVLDKTEDKGQSYIDSIVFIGDSTTHGMAYYGVLKGGKETNQVWTPESGTLAMWNLLSENIVYPEDDSEMLIKDAIAVNTPSVVILTLGVNGVSSLSEDDFKKYYQDLIDVIKVASPDTDIILQSIYPVCDYYQYVNSISMEKINRANSWIAKLADENKLHYLNTISVLVNEKGYLNDAYCNGDGIHISKEGFDVILDYIRTHSID